MVVRKSSSILMLPWLAHGHISPFFELAKKLSERNFHIYLCSTSINLSSIRNKITEKYSNSIQLVELHLPSLPDLPPNYHTTNGLPTNLMATLKTALDMSAPSFSLTLKTLKPDLVIYDFNQNWAPSIASSLNIPAVQFLIFGGVFISFILHRIKNPINIDFPFPAIYLQESESVMVHNLLEFSANKVKDGQRFIEAVEQSCDITLIKSFREIEGKYLDYLSGLTGKKIIPVGPLVQELLNAELDEEDKEIIQWLDKKERCSTVFVSFGSEYFLSKEDMEEIAHGLELSCVNFIWVVRFPKGKEITVSEVMPEGFLERVGERGMIVEGWAPQAKILGHSSTGGFVSHCGWSSVVESMSFGVPVIGMPMHIDQPLNARLVHEVGVGVEVKRSVHNIINGGVERGEIASVIKKVLVERDGEDIRCNVKKMSDNIRMKGTEEIDLVVEELVKLCGSGSSNTN